jgi:hypothetical protein
MQNIGLFYRRRRHYHIIIIVISTIFKDLASCSLTVICNSRIKLLIIFSL